MKKVRNTELGKEIPHVADAFMVCLFGPGFKNFYNFNLTFLVLDSS